MIDNNQATLLCRISSEKQAEGFSLDFQEKSGIRYAEGKKFQITRTWRLTESASNEDRKLWMKYIEEVKRGPEQHILIPKVDRCLRNYGDLALIIKLPKEYGKVLHFFEDGIIFHKDSPASDYLRLGMQGTMAVWYSVDLSQKVKRGMNEKAEQGEWPERAPYGYKNNKLTKLLDLDPERAHWVRRIKELSAVGLYSLDKIRCLLVEEGYPRSHYIHRNLVERIIRNPIYAGRYEWPKGSGTLIRGKHEPIVSWDEHEAAVRGLERLNRPRYRKWDFPFSGILRCGLCEGKRAITFEIKKGRFVYGHCAGVQDGRRYCPDSEYVRQEAIEEQLVGGLTAAKITPEIGEMILSELAKDSADATMAKETQRALIRQEIGRIKSRIEQAYRDKLDGKIEEEFWVKHNRQWNSDQARQEQALTRLDQSGADTYLPSVRQLLELSKRIDTLYFSATTQEKRELLDSVYSNLSLVGKRVDYTYKKPFDLLAEGLRSSNWLAVVADYRTWLRAGSSFKVPKAAVSATRVG